MSNCSDFLIKKEDHTIGNLLAEHLKQHPKVMMAGYKGKQKRLSVSPPTLPLPPPDLSFPYTLTLYSS